MQMSKELQVLSTTKQLQKESYGLPGYDALAQILSKYQHLPKMPKAPQQSDGEPREQQKTKKSLVLNQTFEVHTPIKRIPVPNFQDNDTHVAEITKMESKELENYRTAMCKMSEDILALHSQITSVEGENSQLRSELSMQQDLGSTMLEDGDIDVMTKAEIADRIVSLKCQLVSESSKAAGQRNKIQQLQNDLIKKNDSEKKLVKLQQAHQQQDIMMQRYQGQIRKLASLKTTVCQQEKVIEKMEKLLTTRLKGKKKERTECRKTDAKEKDSVESRRREIESVLAAENSRLREELEKLRHQLLPGNIHQHAQILQPFANSERVRLMEQLEKAEACIRIMSRQMEENARQWGREKQKMLTRLSEYKHGFACTSTNIFHDFS